MYQHTQPGTLLRVCLSIPLLVLLVFLWMATVQGQGLGVRPEELPLVIVVIASTAVIMAGSLLLFHNLSVSVDQETIRLRFGIGLIRKRIPLEQVRSCVTVSNHWWYGWGIHKIPNGWLYNVSGYDAVELTLQSGRVIRIGTDEPQALAAAVQDKIS